LIKEKTNFFKGCQDTKMLVVKDTLAPNGFEIVGEVVTMDITMKVKDGPASIEGLRQVGSLVPCIVSRRPRSFGGSTFDRRK
jgi:hypothetical protein